MKKIIRTMRKLFVSINPVIANKIMYHHITGRKLNLKHPITFNDKINWLKMYEYPYSKVIINCTDKYMVRRHLKKNGCEKYLVNTIDSWKKVSDIDWSKLPNKFVLKCNHGSKYNIVCTDKSKLDINAAKKKLNCWMKEDFGKVSCEPHYSKIKRRILCEEYLGDGLVDLQVWCTYGKVLFITYVNNPHGANEKKTFDEDWNELDFVTSLPKLEGKIAKPIHLDDAIKISKKLSKDFSFLRMDFYIINNDKIRISEMSFSPASGFIRWNPINIDYEFGKKISLDNFINE